MIEMEQETVYGTHEDSHVVMSEKVQSLAGSIYQEFERMIGKYDEDVVKDLMPLVVNVLECLDLSYTENQEHEVELELLREDNEQLVTQYEREKQLRKTAEQKLLETEDAGEDERKDLNGKIESLESIVRMFELKAKNSSDHVYRLEEKEQEMKKEYSKLHERYTELFKTHMDYMERTKIILGSTDRLEGPSRTRLGNIGMSQLNRSTGPISFGFQSLEQSTNCLRPTGSPGEFTGIPASPPDSNHSLTSLRNELQPQDLEEEPSMRGTSEKGWSETLSPVSKDVSPVQDLSEETVPPPPPVVTTPVGRSHTKRETRSGNTLYQELSFQDAEALGEMDEGADITDSEDEPERRTVVNDNFFGMGKEVENLIMENNELLATKNALNIVKDDLIIKVDELTSEQEILREELKSLQTLKNRLKLKVSELEEELKKTKEEAEKLAKSNKSDDEEDVPMAQRKRFTRVEMARVLMERNQYKERFMELQDAVRWQEMLRATRNDPNRDKKKQSVWKFFSGLFSQDERGGLTHHKSLPHAHIHYSAPNHHISPALETMRKRSTSDRKRGLDLIDSGDLCSEKVAARRASERKEQYRQVRAHVRRDDGRLQAYGWSLPAKAPHRAILPPPGTGHQVPVPVPVYCRPLTEKEPGMKIWCATGVNLAGGRTRDGGNIVGASVFYSNTNEEEDREEAENDNSEEKDASPVDELDRELKESERQRQENEQVLSSLVWICTSTKAISKVTVIDANNPADILESFNVCQSHLLCIASVPGALPSDYLRTDESENSGVEVSVTPVGQDTSPPDDGDCEPPEPKIGQITFVSCATGSEDTKSLPPVNSNSPSLENNNSEPTSPQHKMMNDLRNGINSLSSSPPTQEENDISPTPSRRLLKDLKEGILKDGIAITPNENGLANEELEKMSSVLPTMWLGSQNGSVFVHSAVSQWRRCLHFISLRDAVLSIVHVSGRVLCALADGTVAVFGRGLDGQWDLSKYHLVNLGPPQHSIRCLVSVHNKVWCGYKNMIHVLDPNTMVVQASIDAHPRKESQVRQMAWVGDGVWVSIRLDSTLRLYHAHTYQHLQDVDIEPYVSKMLGTGKLGFSFVRITALLISSNRLWIGTGNGVIISVPLTESAAGGNIVTGGWRMPGGVVRVFADSVSSQLTPGTFIPYCSMAHAQLSFHGHRDAVKFFVAVPGCGGLSAATSQVQDSPVVESHNEEDRPVSMLVMSGGEGYIDFRIGDEGDEEVEEDAQQTLAQFNKREKSHLIVWQVTLVN